MNIDTKKKERITNNAKRIREIFNIINLFDDGFDLSNNGISLDGLKAARNYLSSLWCKIPYLEEKIYTELCVNDNVESSDFYNVVKQITGISISTDDELSFQPISDKDVYITANKFGKDLVISFKGTSLNSKQDCIDNAKITPRRIKFGRLESSNEVGFHKGYTDALSRVVAELVSNINRYNPRNLILVGHSLGGAVAGCLAMLINLSRSIGKIQSDTPLSVLNDLTENTNIYCYAIASPRFHKGGCLDYSFEHFSLRHLKDFTHSYLKSFFYDDNPGLYEFEMQIPDRYQGEHWGVLPSNNFISRKTNKKIIKYHLLDNYILTFAKVSVESFSQLHKELIKEQMKISTLEDYDKFISEVKFGCGDIKISVFSITFIFLHMLNNILKCYREGKYNNYLEMTLQFAAVCFLINSYIAHVNRPENQEKKEIIQRFVFDTCIDSFDKIISCITNIIILVPKSHFESATEIFNEIDIFEICLYNIKRFMKEAYPYNGISNVYLSDKVGHTVEDVKLRIDSYTNWLHEIIESVITRTVKKHFPDIDDNINPDDIECL